MADNLSESVHLIVKMKIVMMNILSLISTATSLKELCPIGAFDD